ncbi:hypothetical protein Y1Q_0007168 [Alligator mississippiensis]|uniref:Uncharacterized protein n=1 Tax=Alligator mississippiensis TaxID=8496 RepID=A0A151N6H7_ALLMI|nr:hypothetical protein Y1Q_0007168 [Alligator mississippiensis]
MLSLCKEHQGFYGADCKVLCKASPGFAGSHVTLRKRAHSFLERGKMNPSAICVLKEQDRGAVPHSEAVQSISC